MTICQDVRLSITAPSSSPLHRTAPHCKAIVTRQKPAGRQAARPILSPLHAHTHRCTHGVLYLVHLSHTGSETHRRTDGQTNKHTPTIISRLRSQLGPLLSRLTASTPPSLGRPPCPTSHSHYNTTIHSPIHIILPPTHYCTLTHGWPQAERALTDSNHHPSRHPRHPSPILTHPSQCSRVASTSCSSSSSSRRLVSSIS